MKYAYALAILLLCPVVALAFGFLGAGMGLLGALKTVGDVLRG